MKKIKLLTIMLTLCITLAGCSSSSNTNIADYPAETIATNSDLELDGSVLVKYVGEESEITLPAKVTSVYSEAFTDATTVTHVNIPNSVKEIQNFAFANCESLISVVLPDTIDEITGGAFYRCIGLEEIILPETITSIGGSAFLGCTSLVEVTIPDAVTEIGEGAFLGCSSLTTITIPETVTSIGESAFDFCSALTQINVVAGSYADEYFKAKQIVDDEEKSNNAIFNEEAVAQAEEELAALEEQNALFDETDFSLEGVIEDIENSLDE